MEPRATSLALTTVARGSRKSEHSGVSMYTSSTPVAESAALALNRRSSAFVPMTTYVTSSLPIGSKTPCGASGIDLYPHRLATSYLQDNPRSSVGLDANAAAGTSRMDPCQARRSDQHSKFRTLQGAAASNAPIKLSAAALVTQQEALCAAINGRTQNVTMGTEYSLAYFVARISGWFK